MKESRVVQMFVAGLVLDPSTNSPIVILKDDSGDTALPIWLGLPEASAIASHLKKITPARPMTHDLMITTIQTLGVKVVRVVITGLKENTFLASLELALGDKMQIVDCRPSDGIALAIRTSAPIFVAKDVLAQAQVAVITEGTTEDEEGRENFANIDKEKWSEILGGMDPDDFKYKM
jgi:bifunctional DNase/RNase